MLTDQYIAGFLDADGYIYASAKIRNKKNMYYFEICVGFCNTNLDIINAINAKFPGGNIWQKVRNSPKHKDGWDVRYYGNQALAVLDSVYPHIVIKKRQAEIVRELFVETDYARKMELFEEIRGLNRRGKLIDYKENLCTHQGCTGKVFGHSLCRKHYRWKFECTTEADPDRGCAQCGASMRDHRPDRKFCTISCKAKWHRTNNKANNPPPPKVKVIKPERKCSIEGCDAKHFAKGYCSKHYYTHYHKVKVKAQEGV